MACNLLPWGPEEINISGATSNPVGTFAISSTGVLTYTDSNGNQQNGGTLTISNGCSFTGDSIDLTIESIAYDRITGSLNTGGGTIHPTQSTTGGDPTWSADEAGRSESKKKAAHEY